MGRKPPLYDMDACLICGGPPQWHHVYSADRRKISDREGCVAPLCWYHHQGPHGVHRNRELNDWLRADCQRRWMEREHATVDDFRKVFYVSYLDEEAG